jgi:hypothetical protein
MEGGAEDYEKAGNATGGRLAGFICLLDAGFADIS